MKFKPVINRWIRWLAFSAAAAMLLITGFGYVHGQGLPPTATPAPVVVQIAGDWNYPPYSYLEEGEPKGFDIDLIQAVAETMGIELQISMGPWNEIRQGLRDGQYDVLVGMAYSEQRDQSYDFSVPTAHISFDLFVPQGSTLQGLDDLEGKTVVVQNGGLMQEFITTQKIQVNLVLVENVNDALRLLVQNQYDAALLNRTQGEYFLRQMDLKGVRRVGIDLLPGKYAFAVRDGDSELLARLNEGLYLVNESGEYDRIYEKWFGILEERAAWMILRPYLFGLGGVVLLLLASVVWVWLLRRQVKINTAALVKSEEQQRRLVDHATEGILVSCGDHFVFANPRAQEITGFPIARLVGMTIADLLHPEDREMVMDRYRRRLKGEKVVDYYNLRILTSANETRWLSVHPVVIDWDGQPATLDMFIDITERKEAEDQLKRQLQHMASLRAIDMAITASLDLPLILRVLLEQVTVQLKADAATIFLVDKATQELVYSAGQGFRSHEMRNVRIGPGQGAAGRVLRSRQLLVIPHLDEPLEPFWTLPRLAYEEFISFVGIPLITKGVVVGVLEVFLRTPLKTDPGWMSFLEAISNQAAIAIDNATLFRELNRANQELILAYDATIEGWARALEMRDGDTEGHSKRVADMTVELASAMGLRGEALSHIRRGALLHDIGKMAIPDSILKKEADLTGEEWEMMRQHPSMAMRMLSDIDFLRPVLDIPSAHHEKWDGSGYPRGLKGNDIPLAARIFAVVDVWDALIYDRRYRKSWTKEQTLAYIREQNGSHFDPDVVEVFLRLVEEKAFIFLPPVEPEPEADPGLV